MWRAEKSRIAIEWLVKPRRTALADVADEARRLEAWL
jgi:hypothetical protein